MAVTASRSSSDASRRRAAGRGEAAGVPERLERLTAIRANGHLVVSCYLKLEPRDRARGKYLIKFKNRVREVLGGLPRLGLERSVQEEVARDIQRVQDHLRAPASLPPTQGVAVFACEGIGLFEAVPLPVVHRSRLAVDATPLVRELASVEDEFGRLLTVVFDRMSARFFEVTAYDTRELAGLRADSTRQALSATRMGRAGGSIPTTTASARRSSATSRRSRASCSPSTGAIRRTASSWAAPGTTRARSSPSCITTWSSG
jgi:peptide subunit release factor 1 (eRF1)